MTSDRSGRALRAVLFDAAGTLIEPREPVGETYAREARAFGIEISAWRLGDAFRRVLAQAPPLVFPEAAASQVEALERDWWRRVVRSSFHAADSALAARFQELDTCFDRLFARFAESDAWRPLPGCRDLLRSLRSRGLATGVVSNFDRRLHGILAGLELAPLFDVVVLPSDAGAAKPDPAIFEWALRSLKLGPQEVAFVGDDAVEDVAAARAVGLRAIHVGTPANLVALGEELQKGAP